MSAKKSQLPVPAPPPRPAHLLYPRGSSFYALANCEASYQLSVASGEEPPTPFSDRGTSVHKVISGKLDRASVDREIAEEADYLEAVRQKTFGPWLAGEQWEPVRESRLWLRAGLKPIYSGQPDLYNINQPRTLVLLSDYKTSWHPLDEYVATNCQIRAYVPLIDTELKSQLDAIVAGIHKPGAQSPPAIFNREAINDARAWASAVASKAVEKGPKTPTRGAWCKYCSGKVLCPLWREEVMTMAELSNAISAEIPDSQLRAIAPRLALAAAVIERLSARLEARVRERPDFFKDWRFEPGDYRRKIDNTVAAYNILVVKKKVMSPAEFLLSCRLTVTDLERWIKKNQDTSLRETKELMASLLDGIMEVKANKDKLTYDPKPDALSTNSGQALP